MEFVIRELDDSIVKDINKCDSAFVVDSKIVPRYENGQVGSTVVSVPGYVKRYEPDSLDYTSYIGNPEKTAYLAYIDGEVAGQLILRRNWNRFAWIEDIRVENKFRRRGIGKALLAQGEIWAQQKGFPGIMLETQDSNVGACRFYEKYGFVLGGFDTYLYRAATRYREEIALFWYLVFDHATPGE
jgi:streptothricin acetyltransferase